MTTTRKVRIERETQWHGNGFGTETRHRAFVGDELIGEWSRYRGSINCWALVNGERQFVFRFSDWRKVVTEAA